MTLHKHWSAPAQADEPTHTETPALPAATPNVADAAPALTHVYIGRREYNNDSMTKVFATREACVEWQDSLYDDYDKFEIYHREIGG